MNKLNNTEQRMHNISKNTLILKFKKWKNYLVNLC